MPQPPQKTPERSVQKPAIAGSVRLSFPLACTLGKSCWIARYSDRAEGTEKADYSCQHRTQDNHRGTDFAIADLGQMHTGVSVLAAASGTVKGVRSNEPDISIKARGKDAIEGKECGNGLLIEHTDGWTTQYCHLKQNSPTVKPGDSVKAGQIIGAVGLSGQTEYPHMHFAVRKNGTRMDPFDGQPLTSACNAEKPTPLWAEPIAYSPFALVSVTLSTAPPTAKTRWDAPAKTLSHKAPALVVTGRVFGSQKGDEWQLIIRKPDGSVFSRREVTIKNDRQFWLQYNGRKKPAAGFAPGVWTGEVTIKRQKKHGAPLLKKRTISILIE
ncbi:MAG: M23 family metallopeptidase [Kordiimonadaceae bacterium]|nr:M23 family metallopeptidase [Kordiimonadaceae bacterium]